MKKLKKRLRSICGLTMAEMMLALLILTMVTGVAAGGIPAAINAYTKVVETANAQVLLSTTMTKLREELGTAAEIKLPAPTDTDEPVDGTDEMVEGKRIVTYTGGIIKYESENGSESRIYREYNVDKGEKGIQIREYADIEYEGMADEPDKYVHLLVSKSASNKNLYVTFGDIVWKPDDGILEIQHVKVMNDKGAILSELECADNDTGSVKIRVLSYIY